jgi:hypothetical protein
MFDCFQRFFRRATAQQIEEPFQDLIHAQAQEPPSPRIYNLRPRRNRINYAESGPSSPSPSVSA